MEWFFDVQMTVKSPEMGLERGQSFELNAGLLGKQRIEFIPEYTKWYKLV